MKNQCAMFVVASLLVTVGAGAALGNPASLNGTTWQLQADDASGLTLIIDTTATTGTCPQITGFLTTPGFPADSIRGYYCRATGEVSFLRNEANTGQTFEVYNGQIMNLPPSSSLLMTGSFGHFAGGNNNGDFSFLGVKQ